MSTETGTEWRPWHARDGILSRMSINGDLPGAEDEFPMFRATAERLAQVLNDEWGSDHCHAQAARELRDALEGVAYVARGYISRMEHGFDGYSADDLRAYCDVAESAIAHYDSLQAPVQEEA